MTTEDIIRRAIGKDPILGDDIEDILRDFGVWDKAVAELEGEKGKDEKSINSSAPTIQPSINATLQNDFYEFDRIQILQVTAQNYRDFLIEGGYGDLDKCAGIKISKGLLKWDRNIRYIVDELGIKDGEDNILRGIIINM